MNIESQLLNLLKANQAEFAIEALKRPQERDTFEYGYRVGMVAGYDAAIDVLLNLIDEDKHGRQDL